MPVSAGEHRAIVKAIAAGDAEGAARAMFEHVMESKERTIANHLKRQQRLAGLGSAAPASESDPSPSRKAPRADR